MLGQHFLPVRLQGFSHVGDFRFEQGIQRCFLLHRQRRTGFRQSIAKTNQAVRRRWRWYGSASGRSCTTGCRRCAARGGSARSEKAGGIAKRAEIHVLRLKRSAQQNAANYAEYDFHLLFLKLLVDGEVNGPPLPKARRLAKQR